MKDIEKRVYNLEKRIDIIESLLKEMSIAFKEFMEQHRLIKKNDS